MDEDLPMGPAEEGGVDPGDTEGGTAPAGHPTPQERRRARAARTGSTFGTLPRTRIGKWSAGLIVAFAVLVVFNIAVAVFAPRGASAFNTFAPLSGILMLLVGLAAAVLALVAIIRGHERSWVLWIPVLIGANLVFLIVGEILSIFIPAMRH